MICINKEIYVNANGFHVRLDVKERISKFSLKTFLRPREYPCLNAKAADTHTWLTIMQAICEDHNSGLSRDQMRIICLSSLRSLYNVFYVVDIVLTDPSTWLMLLMLIASFEPIIG